MPSDAILHFVTMLWEPNERSKSFSRGFDERYVENLFRAVQRNLTLPFRFVCFTDRPRKFIKGIEQEAITSADVPWFGCLTERFRLNVPMITTGLDIIITGNIDALGKHCLTADKIAAPRTLYEPSKMCSGCLLVPQGNRWIYDDWAADGSQVNDLKWLRQHVTDFEWIDDLFPRQVIYYRWMMMHNAKQLGDARMVFFAGSPKPHELPNDWVRRNWY